MFKNLRILFILLSAACVIPIFFLILAEQILWALVFLGGTGLFFFLSAFFKKKQEEQEEKLNPTKGDFFAPLKIETENKEEKDITDQENNADDK